MLAKRIIPCLDVKDGKVVKGIQFKKHIVMGEVEELAQYYRDSGADELVFYDITASSDARTVSCEWVTSVARLLDIPFCVAGGIRTVSDARRLLNAGADKISINSPALENPSLISTLAEEFGSQCVVVGIDSFTAKDDYYVYQYTGDIHKTIATHRKTLAWVTEVQGLGAGEIVLNCMNQDGVKRGYDLIQLTKVRQITHLPLIASGGAGKLQDFYDVFFKAQVDGALAASVFHTNTITIPLLKKFLQEHQLEVRL